MEKPRVCNQLSFISNFMSAIMGFLLRRTCGFALHLSQNSAEKPGVRYFQTTCAFYALNRPKQKSLEPRVPPNWPKYNEVVYPPSSSGETKRPVEVTHYRTNIKYSTKKLWYIAAMVQGLSIDEALKQLSFHKRKGAFEIKEVLQEAQDIAMKENVEFKSNLWVETSKVGRGIIIKGYRKNARTRFTIIRYRYTHYFVRLREGSPPKVYWEPRYPSGQEKLQNYLEDKRKRQILRSL